MENLLERFDLAHAYAEAVWTAIDAEGPAAVSPERFNRFVASIFDDGRLADAVVDAERARAGRAAPRDATSKQIARRLRRRFDDVLPKAGLLSRLLRRRG